jgi:hypothetical protein
MVTYLGTPSQLLAVGETVTGATSGATGVIRAFETDNSNSYVRSAILSGVTGTFAVDETVSGSGGGSPTTVKAIRPASASTALAVGNWKLVEGLTAYVDDDATYSTSTPGFYLETVPTASGPDYTFEIAASAAPITGLADLTYDCPKLTNECGYCPASVTYITIEPLVGPDAPSISVDELKARLKEVTPAHVSLVFNAVVELVV